MQTNPRLTAVDPAPVVAAERTFDGSWPFAPHFSTAPGFPMHYIDEAERFMAEEVLPRFREA